MKMRKPDLFASYDRLDVSDRKMTRSKAFVEGFLSGLGGGPMFFEFNPPRYSVRDAQQGDLIRIGRDMYRAMEIYPLAAQKGLTKK